MAEYIKSKALLNALKEERKKGNFVFTSKWIKDIMDNLPAADVVEVRHGEWKECAKYLYKCSLCGDRAFISLNNKPCNYCPNCGAKMDAERALKYEN